ncbi:hypothetical protein FXE19_19080 [Vibrio cholerae]|nr:hypothetical protein FXE19_19080 [Vibrio cholerae]
MPVNARLRGWQRITQNSNATAVTTAAHWDWRRHALTVPLRRLLCVFYRCFLSQSAKYSRYIFSLGST